MVELREQRSGGAVIHMKNVEYLIGSEKVLNTPLQTYSDDVIGFVSQFSRNLMKSPALRIYTDISALAFWCRKANIQKLKESCEESNNRVGRGLCFHIAPGNIPINFAFSYMFGLLAGCSNIVRLSSKQYPQIKPVCDSLTETLNEYPEIQKRTAFIRYPIDDEITKEFCKIADARLIWGGDETIAKVRNMSSKPRCVDVCFSDRYSISIIDGKAILNASDEDISRLVDGFYNDTYLMDQNACSSQQIIFWRNGSDYAKKIFWNAIYKCASNKYELQASIVMDKYTQIFEDILEEKPIKSINIDTNLLHRVELSRLENDITELRGKGGYFYEYEIKSIYEIAPFVTEKFQTVTYFGVEPETIRRLVIDNHLKGIDRIVPIGKAMDIGIMWDGFDLARVLSRLIVKE